ncbi:hypothetical protein JTE90_025708 [Oedothorax gibbosus]|uniref:Odorant receptor n=1 Tax=Oedothorax gibbosus TaxID=931172 RepID=A0AAV6UIA7_9ARAC|nr:hypothetical protein JTE90_025708 [Oedothorax gibbosus]
MNVSTLVQHYNLCKSQQKMKNIAKFLSKVDARKDKWIYPWAVFSTLIHITILAISIIEMKNNVTQTLLFDQVINPTLLSVVGVLYVSFIVITTLLPMNTYAIFYVLVCHNMTSVIQGFLKRLTTNPGVDSLLYEYTSIKNVVYSLDEELSFMVFCNIVFSSTMTYYSISVLLNPSLLQTFSARVWMTLLFLNTMVCFVAMTASATFVGETSAQVGIQSLMLRENVQTFTQQRYLTSVQKEKLVLFISSSSHVCVYNGACLQKGSVASTNKLITMAKLTLLMVALGACLLQISPGEAFFCVQYFCDGNQFVQSFCCNMLNYQECCIQSPLTDSSNCIKVVVATERK